jgi:hypothetical protein
VWRVPGGETAADFSNESGRRGGSRTGIWGYAGATHSIQQRRAGILNGQPTDRHGDPNRYFDSNGYGHFYTNRDGHTYCHTDRHPSANLHPNHYADANRDTGDRTNLGSDRHSYANRDTDASFRQAGVGGTAVR